jgi:hypothetical protein
MMPRPRQRGTPQTYSGFNTVSVNHSSVDHFLNIAFFLLSILSLLITMVYDVFGDENVGEGGWY